MKQILFVSLKPSASFWRPAPNSLRPTPKMVQRQFAQELAALAENTGSFTKKEMSQNANWRT